MMILTLSAEKGLLSLGWHIYVLFTVHPDLKNYGGMVKRFAVGKGAPITASEKQK